MSNFTEDDNWLMIDKFMEKPHLFGHYLGYTDLIDIHSTWIREAWLSKKYYAMQAHRNSYKTTSILIVGTIWYLLFFDPNATIVIIRKADTDAQKVVETIKQFFESRDVIYFSHFLYGIKDLKTKNWSKKSLTLSLKTKKTPEGNVESKGTTSAIVGSHYDFIFPDDIITLKDRVSKAEREWIKDFVRELRNIKKEGGRIYFSGTPWHKSDAWEIIPKPKIYPIGTIPIKGYTQDVIEEKKKELRAGTTRSLYCANYELKHIDDEDKIFSEPTFGKWPEQFRKIIGYLDPKYQGDHTNALTIIGQCAISNNWFFRGFIWEKNVIDIYKEIVNKMILYKAGTLFVESNADKGLSARDISQLYPSVHSRWEKMNKHIKIISYASQHWSKLICAEDCELEYLNQILDYEEGQEPDDAADSLAASLRELGFSGYQKQEAPKVGVNQVLGW